MTRYIPDVFSRVLREASIALMGGALAFLAPTLTSAQTPGGSHEPAAANATHPQPSNSPDAKTPTPDASAANSQQEAAYGTTSADKVKYPGLGPGTKQKAEATIGPVKARLYGTVLLNISFSDSVEIGQDIPLWPAPGSGPVQFPDGTTQRAGTIHDTIFTARQSIFGFTIEPAKEASGEWSPSALVEFDFFGTRPSDGLQPQGRVFNQPRFRKGYFQLQKDTWKILAGQDDIIISPLDPVSLSHVAVPLGATAGDLWGRFPQVRVEKTATLGDFSALLQFGILRPIFGDPRLSSAANPEVPPAGSSIDTAFSGFGERASQPFYQARVAVSHPMRGSTATLGIGGHYGREKVGATRNLDSWAFAFDFDAPVVSRVTLRGEGFVGSNLVPFQGGVLQGVAFTPPTTTTRAVFHKIGAGGGWGELTFRMTDDNKNFFYIGAGTDDPKNHQLLAGTGRAKNTFAWASYFRRLTNNLTLATEWSNWQFRTLAFSATGAESKGPSGRGNVINVALAYQF